MKRTWLALLVLLLTGCGISTSAVTDAGPAPTGVAPGPMLYFVDDDGALTPQLRDTGVLGTVSEAMSLLIAGPGDSGLRTEIAATDTTRVMMIARPGVLQIMVPLTIDDVTPLGIDQIVCTALAVHVQGGGAPDLQVQVRFTLSTPESEELRTCPLHG
ncbi:hypothetical protein [Actinoalloteichus hymeniacidonis]|uniref:Lipoprotein n=1 Tax=Actinoalloteichus hymeniacidonis TaxID=340345 RepID=A0AAC9MX40_9PSEU|nr:hypothetical protein [Actinoalloteichus hymeniacidonis]AOS61935.1 hypothetical protein TL08_05540 [Actinoalloteichus hymeniacidonis]MBB5910045.1 hypothetical protein [Actinoalloteichus hymeniacidonis]